MTLERLILQHKMLTDFLAYHGFGSDRAVIEDELATVRERIATIQQAAEIDAMTAEERRAQVAPVRPGGVD